MGDILAERTAERIQLLSRRSELQGQLLELDSTLPPTDLSLRQRMQAYEQAHTAYDQQYKLVTGIQTSEIAPFILRRETLKLQSLYSDLIQAHNRVQQEEQQYQQDRLNYSLKSSQEQLIRSRLQLVEEELANLVVRAPFSGLVSRIQWIEQTDNNLIVEVTIQS